MDFSATKDNKALFHLELQREPEPCNVSKLQVFLELDESSDTEKYKHTHITDTTHTGQTHTHPDLRPEEILKEYFVYSERKHHILYFVRRRRAIKGKQSYLFYQVKRE